MSESPQLLQLIGKGRLAALASEADRLLAQGETKNAVLTSLEAFNQARCRPPLSRRQLQKIVEDVSNLRAMNARNTRFWDRRSKHFDQLASKLPIDLRNAVQIQHDLEPAIQFLSGKIKGDDEESIAAMKALRPLLRLADTRNHLREVRIVRRAKGRRQVSRASGTRRAQGDQIRAKVIDMAKRILERAPMTTRDAAAAEIAPRVSKSVDRTTQILKESGLFDRRRRRS